MKNNNTPSDSTSTSKSVSTPSYSVVTASPPLAHCNQYIYRCYRASTSSCTMCVLFCPTTVPGPILRRSVKTGRRNTLFSHLHSVTQLEIDTEGGERVFNPRFLPQFFRQKLKTKCGQKRRARHIFLLKKIKSFEAFACSLHALEVRGEKQSKFSFSLLFPNSKLIHPYPNDLRSKQGLQGALGLQSTSSSDKNSLRTVHLNMTLWTGAIKNRKKTKV